MHTQKRGCLNQARKQVLVYVPTKLNPKWCTHIGGDHPPKKYAYCVAEAVHQAGHTREEFMARWKKYRSATKRKGEKHFHEDVFQRFCAAGFGRKTDDGSERRLEFVRRILTENHEPALTPAPAQVRCMFVRRCMCSLPSISLYACMREGV